MIDVKTGLLLWALQALSLSVMLLVLWAIMRRTPALLLWGSGFAIHGLGLTGVALRGAIPDFLSIQVANTAGLFGMGLILGGVQAFDKRPISFSIFLPPFIWTVGMLIPSISQTFWARVALYQLGAGAGFSLIAAALLAPPWRGLNTRSLLALFQAGQALHAFSAAILTVIGKPQHFQDMTNATIFIAIGALCVVASLILGTRMMMLEKEDHLRHLAHTDPLTGVRNRRGLEDAFHALDTSPLPERPLTALIHFDLDYFKRINDRYGHATGDRVLVSFARIIDAVVAGRGVAGRLGGEEFACLLRVASAAEAVEAAGRVRTILRRTPMEAGEDEVIITTSAGISLMTSPGASLDSLLSASDRALYAAKRAGRDRIALDCESRAELVSPEDEAAIADTTDGQVAALNRMGLIGRN